MTPIPSGAPRGPDPSARRRINISFTNRQGHRAVDLRLLRRIIDALLSQQLRIEQAELGICLVGTPEMTRLNETFLHHAGTTDVIAFNYGESTEPDARLALHGEIFACVDEAVFQARRFRTTWQCELVRYIIHGILHLRGFDDCRPAARRIMKREENRLLRGIARRFVLGRLAVTRGAARG